MSYTCLADFVHPRELRRSGEPHFPLFTQSVLWLYHVNMIHSHFPWFYSRNTACVGSFFYKFILKGCKLFWGGGAQNRLPLKITGLIQTKWWQCVNYMSKCIYIHVFTGHRSSSPKNFLVWRWKSMSNSDLPHDGTSITGLYYSFYGLCFGTGEMFHSL